MIYKKICLRCGHNLLSQKAHSQKHYFTKDRVACRRQIFFCVEGELTPLTGKIDTPPPQERKPHTPRDFGPCLAVPWILENCRFNYAKGAQKLEFHGIIFYDDCSLGGISANKS